MSRRTTSRRAPLRAGVAAIESNRQSHDVLADVQQCLYAVLSAAQRGREREWATAVEPALEAACQAIEDHARDVKAPNGLYVELQMDAPWLTNRVERLERRLDRIRAQARDLGAKLLDGKGGAQTETQEIRADTERLLASLRELVTQENELVYERWLETPALD